jgi:ABC-type transporter Mla subunit MlaD
MSRISHFKLGLFVIVCAGFGAVALIWLGAARVFEKTRTYAAFFGEPVTGLQAGAPVDHLGVRIGSVDSVELAPGDRVVRVVVKIRSSFHLDPGMALGLSQAGLTGSAFLALEETPPDQRTEAPHPTTEYPVLATRSGGGGIGGAIQGVERKIASIDVEGLVTSWEGVARDVDAILTRGGVEQVVEDARAASAGVRRVAGAGPRGEPSQLEHVVRDLRATTRSLKAATSAVARQVKAVPPGAVAGIADRMQRAAEVGEQTARSVDRDVDASATVLRQDLVQLRQAAIEAQALARSLRSEPSRVLERDTTDDPFKR